MNLDADLLRGADEQRGLTRRVGCGHEQQPLRSWRQVLYAQPEARFDSHRDRSLARQAETTRKAARPEAHAAARAARGDYRVSRRESASARSRLRAHRRPTRAIPASRHPAIRRAAIPAGRQVPRPRQDRALRRGSGPTQPPGAWPRKREPCGRPVHPLHVIDKADDRTLLSRPDNKLSTASPTRNRSGWVPELKPKAVSNASRCGAGKRSRWSSSCTHSWWRPANGSSISHSAPTAEYPTPSARSAAYSRRADLPIPASPRSTRLPLCPSCVSRAVDRASHTRPPAQRACPNRQRP